MSTYKTYAAAKIANPYNDILTNSSLWIGPHALKGFFVADDGCFVIGEKAWIKADPAEYCSTIEDFFNGGYKFEVGDKYLEPIGDVVCVGSDISRSKANRFAYDDKNRYILSAKALNGGCNVPEKFPEEYLDSRNGQDQQTIPSNLREIADEMEKSNESMIEFERGMIDCCKKIAKLCGKSFAVDVGYDQLPYVVANYIFENCKQIHDEVCVEWKDGIPPVGVECECDYGGKWAKCFIVAHRHGTAVIETDYLGYIQYHKTTRSNKFRPIKTQEDIEREKVEKLAQLLCDKDYESGCEVSWDELAKTAIEFCKGEL